MKAAVIFPGKILPEYADAGEPVAFNENQVLMTVIAAAIKNIDKSRATGKHYSSEIDKGSSRVIGGDGVGILPDGRIVYAIGISGMVAEKAVVNRKRMVDVPPGLSHAMAAAIPNAVIGSAMALRFKGKIKAGDVVLINGATGFTGRMAVQTAKFYGAKKIIVTGRNSSSLKTLTESGADELISTGLSDEEFISALQRSHRQIPIDIVIDYLWGHPAELVLDSLKGNGSFTHPTRFVSVGSVLGDHIHLSAATMRSCDLHLCGSGLGSWKEEEMDALFADIIPQSFMLAAENRLKTDIVELPLRDIGQLEHLVIPSGQRLVITMNNQVL